MRSADGRPLPLQVDGDYLGEVTEARYSILPGRADVVCLSWASTPASQCLLPGRGQAAAPGVTR